MTESDFENFLVFLRRFLVMKKVGEIRNFRRMIGKIFLMTSNQFVKAMNEIAILENAKSTFEPKPDEFKKLMEENFPECHGL